MNRTDEERLNDWNTDEAKKYIVHDIFLVIYFITGVFGNIVVLIVYRTKLRKKSDSRYFIPILAFADFFACSLRVPFELWKSLLPVNFQDIIGCQIVWFLVNIFHFSSIFLVAVITFQRYLKVCRPFNSQMTIQWRRGSLVIILLLSIACSGPFIIWNEKLEIPNAELNVTGYICGANVIKIDKNSDSFLGFIFFISIAKIFVMMELICLNTMIGRQIFIVLKRNKTRNAEHEMSGNTTFYVDSEPTITSENSDRSTDGTSNRVSEVKWSESRFEALHEQPHPIKDKSRSQVRPASKRFSYMFMVIGLAFILSYIPQIILLFSLINDRFFWIKSTPTEIRAFKFLDQMVTINNIVNPYIYGFFDKKFKDAVKCLFCGS